MGSIETIGVLLGTPDRAEQIRDQIGLILAESFAEQVQLAGQDPNADPVDFDAEVYLERTNPWEDPARRDLTPIVNVSRENSDFDGAASSTVNYQRCEQRYNVDCIAFGKSRGAGGGHEPGDKLAAMEVQRVARQVRQVLSSPQNVYLQLRGVVEKRWVQSIQMLQPPVAERPQIHVVAARLVVVVHFRESSPEPQGEPLEMVAVEVERSADGKVLLEAQYDYSEEEQ